MRLIYLTFLLSIISSVVYTQNFKAHLLKDSPAVRSDSASLYFEFTNSNFFKNNEYSNDILNGYTLLGFNAAPKLSYYLSKNTKITGGANFLKYFGKEPFHEINPVFQVQQKLTPDLSFIIGTINNSDRHALIRPLYHPELLLTDPTEYGLQFLFQNTHFKVDLWLDWQRFITKKSDFQEEFITGFSSETQILSKNAPIELSIPLQMVIKHKGGQIGEQDNPISTLANSAVGLSAKYPLAKKKFLEFENIIAGYNKITDKNKEPFNKGLGLYSSLRLGLKAFNLNFSYWQGSKFLTIAGDPIYQSYSLKNDEKLPKRKMLEAGLQYSKDFPYSTFVVNFQWIYDLMYNNPDYFAGLYLYINLNRVLLKP
jgi:hypothetical protein